LTAIFVKVQFIPNCPYLQRLPPIDKSVFEIDSRSAFNERCLQIFQYQYSGNPVYRKFCDLLRRTPQVVKSVEDIPFLPIEIFKTHTVVTGQPPTSSTLTFRSSGTTGANESKHFVMDPNLYETSFLTGFTRFYGPPSDYRILALLPSYIERGDSSLVYMAERLIRESGDPSSGFFLNDLDALREVLNAPTPHKTLLIGVSYALLDLVEAGPLNLKNTTVMETGGMKGRRRELTRTELHVILQEGLGLTEIHSEYGMTELLSQAYAKKDGHFETPPWMKLLIRDANDPLSPSVEGRSGGINVIDLANIHSCSFVATSDLGRALPDGKVEVLGRFDYSDMRGCNLLVGG